VLAEVLAVGSAAAAGAAVVAQQRATHELGGTADHRLLRRPWWLAGTGASVVASALQAVALASGAVVVVQALLATAVAWTTVGEALLHRRLPGPRALVGAGLAMLGPLLVVVLLGPVTVGGVVDLASTPVALSLVGVGVVAAAGLVAARLRPGPGGALGLALACGAGYGLAASLLAVLARDPGAVLTDPQHALAAVLLLVVGPAAFVLSQRALARARRAGPVVTVILLVDPLVATAIGATWFGERLALDAPTVAGIVVAAGLAVVGVRLLDPAPERAPATT
jgi:drug/metabolite transporter (DMT)-like permease